MHDTAYNKKTKKILNQYSNRLLLYIGAPICNK